MSLKDNTQPRVFLSYTGEDLRAFADAVARVARSQDLVAVDHRDWGSTGRPSVEECRSRVGECDALVVIVAHRYGWVPPAAEGGDGERSITWLEVEEARRRGLEVLPFLVADDASWPTQQIEGLRNPAALNGLDRFKEVLRKSLVSFFTDEQALATAAATAFANLQKRLRRAEPSRRSALATPPSDAIAAYRQRLEQATRHVELIGFGEQFQIPLPIDELYVPLRVHVPRSLERRPEAGGPKALETAEAVLRDVPLEDAFRKAQEFGLRGAVLLGDPGSGKSTAARRLCWRSADLLQGAEVLGLPAGVVPVLLSLRKVRPELMQGGLEALLRAHLGSLSLSDSSELPDLMLRHGRLLWILDGLDEVADSDTRQVVSGWIAAAEAERPDDWFLVTSRYAGYEGAAQLKSTFLEMHVQPLDADQQGAFVSQWYTTVERHVRGADARALSLASQRAAELIGVLRGPDFVSARLASMVANPLLLSILCIVHRKDVDLPRRRADLYAKCLDVLLESWRHEWRKEQGRDGFDVGVARLVLEPLAWHLHANEKRDGDRQELLPVVERALARVSGAVDVERDPERFLEAIRHDSGLLVSAKPGRYAFLHLTFQEYLAARHAFGSIEPKDLARHYGEPWWNETILLAAGIATSERFMEEFLDEVLKDTGFEVHDELSSYLVSEALILPAEPFRKRLRSLKTPPARLRAILRAILRQASIEAPFVAAARKLSRHADKLVREAAADVLVRAGEQVPAEARASDAAVELDERTDVTFVKIPAGEFSMGGTMLQDEQPVHRVRVKAFFLARTPVTNAQYERFLKETAFSAPAFWTNRQFNRPDLPVVGVSWEEAQQYCIWAGFALPTEAQWEYACRAGTKTEYWSGDSQADLARVGWFEDNSDGRLHAVAEKEASPFGLFDMHGNVWEWCQDAWSDKYSEAQRVHPGPYELQGAPDRVGRGGSFRDSAQLARSAFRYGWSPEDHYHDLGFRPARDITTG